MEFYSVLKAKELSDRKKSHGATWMHGYHHEEEATLRRLRTVRFQLRDVRKKAKL